MNNLQRVMTFLLCVVAVQYVHAYDKCSSPMSMDSSCVRFGNTQLAAPKDVDAEVVYYNDDRPESATSTVAGYRTVGSVEVESDVPTIIMIGWDIEFTSEYYSKKNPYKSRCEVYTKLWINGVLEEELTWQDDKYRLNSGYSITCRPETNPGYTIANGAKTLNIPAGKTTIYMEISPRHTPFALGKTSLYVSKLNRPSN